MKLNIGCSRFPKSWSNTTKFVQGSHDLVGMMIESNLRPGKQSISSDRRPREGGYQSGGSRGGYRGNRDANSSTSQSSGSREGGSGAPRDANRGPYKPQRKRY